MIRRLRKELVMDLDRPFALFVEPGDLDDDGNIEWLAKIVGHKLDHMVAAKSPQMAIVEGLALLNSLTGTCCAATPDHNFIIKAEVGGNDAWECARCGEVAAACDLEEIQ